LSPRDPNAYTALGMVRAKQGRLRESIQAFKKAASLNPASLDAHLNLGVALGDGLNTEAALLEFSEAVRVAPDSSTAHYNRGRALYDLNRYDEAQPELEAAAHASPNAPLGLDLLAIIARQRGNSERAVELWEKLVTRQPVNAEAHFELGQDLIRVGRASEALSHWETAIEINPDYGEALYNLQLYVGREQPEKAQVYGTRYTDFRKRHELTEWPDALDYFALNSARSRNWPQAVARLREAMAICKGCRSEQDIHKSLGLIYSRCGDFERGKAELHKALDLRSNDAEAAEALKMLDYWQNTEAKLNRAAEH
jgi:tetratricopeptide (TPR) repeat protein